MDQHLIRKNVTDSGLKSNITPLQILLNMGFSKLRAEKALSATGNRNVQLAADWLLAHVNDSQLDQVVPREYVLYACPTGRLLEQLKTFWTKSFIQCGWNGVHNFVPHITLIPFFEVNDEHSRNLSETLQSFMQHPGVKFSEPLKVELYTSQNYMGLFVSDEHTEHLKRISKQFLEEIDKINQSITAEPNVKSFHLTLSYQFPDMNYVPLKNLVDELNIEAPCTWELRLYSREQRVIGNHVHKVIKSYTSTESDELDLRIGDYIYITPDSLENSHDGWVEGTSWLTGTTGLVLENYTKRTSESDAWTLHTSCPLIVDIEENSAQLPKTVDPKNGNDQENCQNIFIMRHGERVDFTFGAWIPHTFTNDGTYVQKDLNMPKKLFDRNAGFDSYLSDTPLTNIGIFHAKMVGEALKENNVDLSYVYCSPSLRSIQTCDAVLEGYGRKSELKICLEPGLFEWMHWYQDSQPIWMTPNELLSANFNIDLNYSAVIEEGMLKLNETCDDYYDRSALVMQSVLRNNNNGNIFMVGHAATLDTCSRELLGKSGRPLKDMLKLIQKIPYCSLLHLERSESNNWKIAKPTIPSCTHSTNIGFDSNVLLD